MLATGRWNERAFHLTLSIATAVNSVPDASLIAIRPADRVWARAPRYSTVFA